MSLIHSLIATGMIAFVSLTPLPAVPSEPVNPSLLNGNSMTTQHSTSFQPGMNRAVFRVRENEWWEICICRTSTNRVTNYLSSSLQVPGQR